MAVKSNLGNLHTYDTGDVAGEIARLKRQPGNDIHLTNSSELAQTVMKYGLADEYELMIHPLILGSGKTSFQRWRYKTDPEPPGLKKLPGRVW